MSRFEGSGSESYPNEAALWWNNIDRALNGKRGQKLLLDVERALEAMPDKRLVYGKVITPDGEACAVGAYVIYKAEEAGFKPEDVFKAIAPHCKCKHPMNNHENGIGSCKRIASYYYSDNWDDGSVRELCSCNSYRANSNNDDLYDTQDVGVKAGLTAIIAWWLAYENDWANKNCSSEDRYKAVLKVVKEKIHR